MTDNANDAGNEDGATGKKRGRANDDGAMAVVISPKPAEFIIAPKQSAGAPAVQMFADGGANIIDQLRTYSGLDIRVVRTLRPANLFAAGAMGGASALLVEMDQDKGRQLQAQVASRSSAIWVEANERMELMHGFGHIWRTGPQYSGLFDAANAVTIDINVMGDGGRPLAGATVTLHGLGFPMNARTDANGMAQISTPQSSLNAITAIVIDPASMHWSKVVRNPNLQAGRVNAIRVQSFKEFDADYGNGATSWGVKRLGAAAQRDLTGRGVKVGVIDTGCDITHPALTHVKGGGDFNPNAGADTWKIDENGHGTHCAGVVGANAGSVRGMAPEADLYIYKVFPDATFFTLDAAMETAISNGVDILSMSLGSDVPSDVLTDQFERAREAGVLCIVAAGNTGDGVKFPAHLSSAVAVSAMGSTLAIPIDSISAQTFNPAFFTPDGDFSPRFTCFGNEIDFVAPGVGVIAPVPNGGYRAMDGTSMATPHVAGLAALALAHDPALQRAPKNAARVDMLVERLRAMCSPLPWGAARAGAGLPTLGVAPLMHAAMFATPFPWEGWIAARH